jgi:ADP-heptose:LPS heptosyltransferase
MISQSKRKAVVFISAGLGDAILLLPLVELLRNNGYSVTGLVTSVFPCEQLFPGTTVFDHLLVARTKARKGWLALKDYRNYQLAIVNYFAASRSNLLLAKQIATMVHTNRIPQNSGKRIASQVVFFKPKEGIHDAEQNMLLAGNGMHQLKESALQLPIPLLGVRTLPETFIALQLSANHNHDTYKNWPVKHWISFLHLCRRSFPGLKFILLGDVREMAYAEEVVQANTGNMESLAGQTTIPEAVAVIQRCALFLGLDGGLMHLAAALGKTTFTLWGPSNPLLYGYEIMNPEKHKVISLHLPCSPCSAWISPNISRFKGPEECRTRECLADLLPDAVFREFINFAKKHALV